MNNENIELTNEELNNIELEQTSTEEYIASEEIEFEEGASMSIHSYVKLSDKYADVLSSAGTMLLVGGVGIIVLIGIISGVIPLNLGSTAWLFYSVMGLVFLAFIIAGFVSLKNAMQLKEDAAKEDALINEINTWAKDNIKIDDIDDDVDNDQSIEELFFVRFAYIKNILMHQFEEADEPLIDELSEQIYQDLFEDENTVFEAQEIDDSEQPSDESSLEYDSEE